MHVVILQEQNLYYGKCTLKVGLSPTIYTEIGLEWKVCSHSKQKKQLQNLISHPMYIQIFQNILHNVLFFSLRASRAAGPQSSYHQSLLYPPHLETHSVLSRVSAGVEGGGRLDMHIPRKQI